MSIEDSDAPLLIVEAGRQRALVRMREAFARQADGHTDLAGIDPAVLDRLVQEAADRAGASLWRISLAEGAAQQFGIDVSEALAHPAVAAAEQLVDAPAEPGIVPGPGPGVEPAPEPTATAAPVPVPPEPTETSPEPAQAPEPPEQPEPPEPEPTTEPQPAASASDSQPAQDAVRVAAIHASGIETLAPGEDDLELRLSDDGLDVLKRSTGTAIGRLNWSEITTISVGAGRRGLRGRKPQTMQVQTGRGQATFDLPELTEEDAAAHVQPLLERLRDAGVLER